MWKFWKFGNLESWNSRLSRQISKFQIIEFPNCNPAEVIKLLQGLEVIVTLRLFHQNAPRVVPATAWPFTEAACA